MRSRLRFDESVGFFGSCFPTMRGALALGVIVALAGCSSAGKKDGESGPAVPGLTQLKAEAPVELKLKADPARVEKVSYTHRSRSLSYEDNELRHQRDEALEFVSQAETKKIDAPMDRFTQVISIANKNGTANLHDFAMPEVGEKLEVTADSTGKIIKSGDYPPNSIFYVPPISLPKGPVSVGETWTMQSTWLSLEEMVPYQLDMVSILKNLYQCGQHRCAELEISGEVGLQGPITQVMAFKSLWKGKILFDIDAGTVLWSRVDSDEQFTAGNVRRTVGSCLEAVLTDPSDIKLAATPQPTCAEYLTKLPTPPSAPPPAAK